MLWRLRHYLQHCAATVSRGWTMFNHVCDLCLFCTQVLLFSVLVCLTSFSRLCSCGCQLWKLGYIISHPAEAGWCSATEHLSSLHGSQYCFHSSN